MSDNTSKIQRTAIFASGNGSNAENIIRYFRGKSASPAEMVSIYCNKPDAYVCERANNLGIPCHCFTRDDLNEGRVLESLKEEKIDFIVLAGFLWKIPENLLLAFPDSIVNIHPALLPKHGGKGMHGDHVHQAVIADHDKESGITIHLIDSRYDCGTTVFQATCPVEETDTWENVAEKVHALEYQYYPQIIDRILQERQ